MKRYEDMTDDELLELYNDDDAFALCVDYECALGGVALLPPKPVEPKPVGAKPDMEAWHITCDLFLMDRGEAEALRGRINAFGPNVVDRQSLLGSYSYRGPYTLTQEGRKEPAGMVREEFWSQGNYDEHKADLVRFAEQSDAYKKLSEEYISAAKERAAIADSVRSRMGEVYEERRERSRARTEFDRYVSLAEGDKEMALRFFLKAKPQWGEEWARETLGFEPADEAEPGEGEPGEGE